MNILKNGKVKINRFLVVSLFFIGTSVQCNSLEKPDKVIQNSGEQKVEGLDDSLIPPVVAKVNNVDITRDRVKISVKAILEKYKMKGETVDTNKVKGLIKQVVGDLIIEELIYQEGKRLNIAVKEEELKGELEKIKAGYGSEETFNKILKEQGMTAELVKDELEREMSVRRIIKTQIDDHIVIDIGDVKKYYESNKEKFKHNTSVKASHILIKVPEQADEKMKKDARERIEAVLKKARGGEDFGKLAKEFSNDPSAEKGGDLGYFSQGEIFPPFERAVFSLKPGEISDVIQSQFGYHILKVYDRKEMEPHSFEELKDKITDILKSKKRDEGISLWLEELRKKGKVEMAM